MFAPLVIVCVCTLVIGARGCSSRSADMPSGRHAIGSRTRANGYRGRSGWCKTTAAELRAREVAEAAAEADLSAGAMDGDLLIVVAAHRTCLNATVALVVMWFCTGITFHVLRTSKVTS